MIMFIPPDGEFDLMTYRLTAEIKPLFWIEVQGVVSWKLGTLTMVGYGRVARALAHRVPHQGALAVQGASPSLH